MEEGRNYDNDGLDPSEEYFRRKKKGNDEDTYFPPEESEPVIEWAEFKGYPLPEKPYGFLFNVAIIYGFLCGLIPGILLCYFAQKRKDNYKKEIRALTTKWVDSGKTLKPFEE